MVHCSMSVIDDEAVGFDFFDTLTTEFSNDRTRLSSSSCRDRLLGSNFERSKNSPLWMSLIYYPGMSWKGDAKLTAAVFVRTVVSGAVPGTSDAGLWGRRLDEAFTATLAASVAISLVDCFTVSAINCWIVCIWPSVNSGRSCLCAVVTSMFGAVDSCSLMFCRVGGGLFSSRSRRSRVFPTPVDCISC